MMVAGLVVLSYLTYGSVVKGLMMAAVGLILGAVGNDTITGVARYTFNITVLSDGIGFIPVVMGLFGVAEVLTSLEEKEVREVFKTSDAGPSTRAERLARLGGAIARGSVLGFLLGILPGGGAVLASFVSYAVERRVSRTPENFGKGAIAGRGRPGIGQQCGVERGLYSPAIPGHPVECRHGDPARRPADLRNPAGPAPDARTSPELFWGVIASMYLGNVMLLILNLPLIGLWVKLLKVPYRYLFPLILLFCLIGVYSVNSSAIEVVIMVIFGLVGYLLRKYRFEPAPLVLALILGPMLEVNFRQSLILSHGDLSIFLRRPLAAVLLIVSAVLLVYPILQDLRKERRPSNA